MTPERPDPGAETPEIPAWVLFVFWAAVGFITTYALLVAGG